MEADSSDAAGEPRRPGRRRLRILLGLTGLFAALVFFTQLDPDTVRMFGPAAEPLYDFFHAPADRPLTLTGQRMVDELKRLGGHAVAIERTPGWFGILGRRELFSIDFAMGGGAAFGDRDLARLVRRYGDRIGWLHLGNTRVTDAGLRVLAGLTELRHLGLGEEGPRDFSRDPVPTTGPITDAGLVHLRDLTNLQSLHICGVPVTDAGIEPLGGLTGLHVLFLNRTQVRGPGLGRLKALPRLGYLALDGSPVTGSGLRELSGLPMLGVLTLNGIPLSGEGLAVLESLRSLSQLEVRDCGLTDDQVKELKGSNPTLKLER